MPSIAPPPRLTALAWVFSILISAALVEAGELLTLERALELAQERGYERIDERLRGLGAAITRVDEATPPAWHVTQPGCSEFMVIPARSDNDTGNNPHNPMYGIARAGANGSI